MHGWLLSISRSGCGQCCAGCNSRTANACLVRTVALLTSLAGSKYQRESPRCSANWCLCRWQLPLPERSLPCRLMPVPGQWPAPLRLRLRRCNLFCPKYLTPYFLREPGWPHPNLTCTYTLQSGQRRKLFGLSKSAPAGLEPPAAAQEGEGTRRQSKRGSVFSSISTSDCKCIFNGAKPFVISSVVSFIYSLRLISSWMLWR